MWILDRLIAAVVTVLYAVIIVAMFAQVVFRYALGSPLSWSEETSRYMFIWLCYLGAYLAVVRNAHVGVDYLTRHFSAVVMRRLNIVFAVVSIVALGFVAYRGALLALDNARAEWWTIPFLSLGLAYAAVPVGAALMILAFLRVLIRLLAGRPPYPEPEASAEAM
jgi:TRAP-type C4-dicarboxylate transport system permease small subunit